MVDKKLDTEFYCEAFDHNIPNLKKYFFASIHFDPNSIVITCLDASQTLPSELYLKYRGTKMLSHRLSFGSIQYIMQQGRNVCIVGYRKNVQLQMSPNSQIILEDILSNTGCGEHGFIEVKQLELLQFIGEATFRCYVISQETIGKPADKKFWRNLFYAPLLSPHVHSVNRSTIVESQNVIVGIYHEVMLKIVRELRRDVMDGLKIIRNILGYDEKEMSVSFYELIDKYYEHKRINKI